jgi:hypothetical protein
MNVPATHVKMVAPVMKGTTRTPVLVLLALQEHIVKLVSSENYLQSNQSNQINSYQEDSSYLLKMLFHTFSR